MLRSHFVIYIFKLIRLSVDARHFISRNRWLARHQTYGETPTMSLILQPFRSESSLPSQTKCRIRNTIPVGNPTETDIWVIMLQNKWNERFCPEANWRVKTQICDVILIYSVEPLCWQWIEGWLWESEITLSYSEKVILNSVTVTFSTFYNLFSAELYISLTNSN